MPYHLSEDGKVVLGEDGQPVPGGQHDTHADALAHMQAMNINVHDVDAPPPKDDTKTAAIGSAAGETPTAASDTAAAPAPPTDGVVRSVSEKQMTATATPVASAGTPNVISTPMTLTMAAKRSDGIIRARSDPKIVKLHVKLNKAVQDIPGLAHAMNGADCGHCQYHREFLEEKTSSVSKDTSTTSTTSSTTAVPITYCSMYDSKVQCDWTCDSWEPEGEHPDAQPIGTTTENLMQPAPGMEAMFSQPRGDLQKADEVDQPFNFFVPIVKIDQAKREVYGYAILEQADRAHEIMDYESSKPHFVKWSSEVSKDSNGKSKGNVREMHQDWVAGKLTQFEPDDAAKGFWVAAKVIDDEAWAKVDEGAYTGFSVGGRYIRAWPDGTLRRYTAEPSEISLVDRPCVPGATYQMVKNFGGQDLSFEAQFRSKGTGQDHLWIAKAADLPTVPAPIESTATRGEAAKPTDKDIQARVKLDETVKVHQTFMQAREIGNEPTDALLRDPLNAAQAQQQYRPKMDLSAAGQTAAAPSVRQTAGSATPPGGVRKKTDKIKITGGKDMKPFSKDEASAILSQVQPIMSAVHEQAGRGEVDRALLDQLAAALHITAEEASDMHTEQTSGSTTKPAADASAGTETGHSPGSSTLGSPSSPSRSGNTPTQSTPTTKMTTPTSSTVTPLSSTPSSGDYSTPSDSSTSETHTETPTMSKNDLPAAAPDNPQTFDSVPPRSNMIFQVSEDEDQELIVPFLRALDSGSLKKAQELVGRDQPRFDRVLTKALSWYMTEQGITSKNIRKLHAGAPSDFDPDMLKKSIVATDIPGIYLMRLAKLMLPVYAGLVRRLPAATPETGAEKAQWRALLGYSNLNFANNLHVAEGAIGDEITETFLTFATFFRDLALNDKVTLKATAASRNYDDPLQVAVIRALTALLQLQERKIIGDNTAAVAAPASVTGTPSTTGGTLAAATLYQVRVTSLTYTGFVGNVKGGSLTAGAGESAPVSSANITTTGATSSIAATWPVVPGAAAYNVYLTDTTGANPRWVATVTANAYTITAYPGSGNAPPSDTTAQTTGYEGLISWCELSTIYGNAIPNRVANIDMAGGALTTNGSGITQFDTILSGQWTQWQISPTLILTSPQGVSHYTSKIMSLNMPQYRVDLTDKQGQAVGGTFVTYYVNKFAPWADGSQRTIEIMAHPYMPNGTYLFLCESVPYPMSRESRGFARDTLIPYTYFPLAQTQINYPFAVTLSETLECFHPSPQTAVVGVNMS